MNWVWVGLGFDFMRQPTPEQLAKLPAWAKQHIQNIQLERNAAMRTLNEFTNSQTPSNVFFEVYECYGENGQSGPTKKRLYIQGDKVTFKNGNHEVEVRVDCKRDRIEFRTTSTICGVSMIRPVSSNVFELIPEL